ncbi:hypothetical protein DXG01_010115 [Tephrocybe rancida]|nr:hypothetical protein DXG01_010115 [Tephrocybe rancida]
MSTPSKSTSSPYVPPESPSPILQSLLAYIEALNEWSAEKAAALFDESLEHQILPSSIGRPILNKQQYIVYFASVIPLFKAFRITLHEVIEAGDVITIHGSSVGESVTGAPYRNEYMMIMHFAPPVGDDLPKITRVKEFVDGASVVKFFTEERAKAAKAAAT